MLSYQHGFHAGNRADILKHSVLYSVLQYTASEPAPLLYIETHAGRGRYDLKSEQAKKTGEAARGVLAFPKTEKAPPPLQAWLGYVRACGTAAYPGSPRHALDVLSGDTSRFVFFEKHPAEFRHLQDTVGADPRARAMKSDGYNGALKLQPRSKENMLVFLDPSYETLKDMDALALWLPRAMKRWPRAQFLVWLPLFADGREDEFGAYISGLDTGFVAGTRWSKAADAGSALEGSAIIGLRIGGPAAKRAFKIAACLDALWPSMSLGKDS